MPDILPNDPARCVLPSIVDVEASGFGSHSYPIEIGVVLADGTRYCSLIAPDPTWIHWDSGAESLHGLNRAFIEEKGKSAEQVAVELNALLGGQTVYTDAWTVDYPWIRTLFQGGRTEMEFQVRALEMILSEEDLLQWDAIKEKVGLELEATRHRASWDAMVIQQTYSELQARRALTNAAPILSDLTSNRTKSVR